MALLTKRNLRNMSGLQIIWSQATASDTVPNPGDDTFLLVNNTTAGALPVTLVTPGNLPTNDAYPDKVISVPATTMMAIPVPSMYADANGVAVVTSGGAAGLSYSVVTDA